MSTTVRLDFVIQGEIGTYLIRFPDDVKGFCAIESGVEHVVDEVLAIRADDNDDGEWIRDSLVSARILGDDEAAAIRPTLKSVKSSELWA